MNLQTAQFFLDDYFKVHPWKGDKYCAGAFTFVVDPATDGFWLRYTDREKTAKSFVSGRLSAVLSHAQATKYLLETCTYLIWLAQLDHDLVVAIAGKWRKYGRS